jgi:hypothetical protein
VNLLLNVPLNAEMGTYAGKIMVIYRKPW